MVGETPEELSDYVIRWGDQKEERRGIPLGYGALYNHSDNFNARWETDVPRSVMIVAAARDIAADEEILICYGPLWFSERGYADR